MTVSSELFRFRVNRPVLAQQPGAGDLIPVTQTKEPVTAQGASGSVDPRTWQHWLATLSTALARRGDAVSPDDLLILLPADWATQAGAAGWRQITAQLGNSLLSALKSVGALPTAAQIAVVEGLCRLLRVQDMITTLSADAKRKSGPKQLRSARDVKALVGHKPVVLPGGVFPNPLKAVQLVRAPGVTDLYLVKDEWNRYEPGELARVINVLPGETFDNRLKHFEKSETSVSTTVETATSQQTENSQTQSTTLSQSSSKDAALNIGVQGQVEVSAQYGPMQIQASLGAQLQSSQSESQSRAMTIASQTVQRSIKEVSQTTIDVQARRTTVGDESAEEHKLSNSGSSITVGLYRWLNEIHRVQLMRYPNRFVLEFELPEPGAWLRWAMQQAPVTTAHPNPGPFRLPGTTQDLSPTDIDANSIGVLAQQWRIQGLTAPPAKTMTLSVALTEDPSSQNEARFATMSDSSLIVPDGYKADSWSAEIFSTRTWRLQSYGTELTVTVGGSAGGQASTGDLGQAAFVSGALTGTVGSINTGAVPVSVYTIALQGFTCVVNVVCSLMPETYRQWQETVFDQVADAYQGLLTAYQQELAANSLQPGSVGDLIGPPALNAQRVTAELRRLVIENLMNQRFNGEPAIATDPQTGEPSVDLTAATSTAAAVQFFEQAFEWENLVYICYPYYWARRAQWTTNALGASADPEFDQFLNSGSARVVVPARPGFEALVNFYLFTGVIWGGSQPPAPNDPDYLSIAQEIQAIQTGADDGTPVGSSWEISLPTTLLWAGTDLNSLPTNPSASIPPPTVIVINAILPEAGAVGDTVTVTGGNFGATQGSGSVSFGSVAATVSSWSATSITTTVPAGAGTAEIVVTVNGVASNPVPFTVT